MKRLIVLLALLLIASSAHANLVTNGDFSAGLTGWTTAGAAGIYNPGDFGIPASPSGGSFAGTVSSWGGDWGGPLGSITQQITGTGPLVVSGELYAGAHAADAWRNVAVEVLWNGSIIASQGVDADPVKFADQFAWVTFSQPVVGTGSNELKVQWIVHYAEWSWVEVDNLVVVPEPGTFALLGSGLVSFAGVFIRRRK